MKGYVFAAATAVALAAAGCATLESLGLSPLRFSEDAGREAEFRLLGPSSDRPYGGAALRIWTRVENPNGFGLTLTDIRGDLFVEDADAFRVDFPLGLPLTALQDTVVPLDVSIGFDDLPRLGQIARAAIFGARLDYRLTGTFGVDAGAYGRPRFGPMTLLEGDLSVR
ncbi:MAG TPA: LEA type 2 family protein [Gemmatimonadota bacterium]|nr:LEA type 2 family protein [Gemmatimonadota bacterium]